MKIAFVTSMFGLDNRKNGEFEPIKNCDHFLFTDRDSFTYPTSWKIHDISSDPNVSKLKNNVLKSRYAKFLSWRIFQSLQLDYDLVFYCDSVIHPRNHVDWFNVAKKIQESTTDFLYQSAHPGVSGSPNPLQHELRGIFRARKDGLNSILNTIVFFKKKYKDVDLKRLKSYYANTFLAYNPRNKFFQKISSEFWSHYSCENITYRDQPLWNVILSKYKINIKQISGCEMKNLFINTYGSGVGNIQYTDTKENKAKMLLDAAKIIL